MLRAVWQNAEIGGDPDQRHDFRVALHGTLRHCEIVVVGAGARARICHEVCEGLTLGEHLEFRFIAGSQLAAVLHELVNNRWIYPVGLQSVNAIDA